MSFKYWLPHLQNSISKDCSKQEQTTGIDVLVHNLTLKGIAARYEIYLFIFGLFVWFMHFIEAVSKQLFGCIY